jgi:Fe2+ or Zn2+ uptake regulation protein
MSTHITPLLDSYALKLRAHGFRLTPQRLTILRILQESKRHLTPLDVFELASQAMPGLTEPTVYRTLAFLAEQGLVMAAHVGSGQLVYEFAEHSHHHLVCRACGGMKEIDHAALEPLYEKFQASTGYRIDSVHLTFFGLCPACQKHEDSPAEDTLQG